MWKQYCCSRWYVFIKTRRQCWFGFTRGDHNILDIYYIFESYFHLPINTIPNNSNIINLFRKTLRDIILIYHDIAGLDMNLEEWKQLCCEDRGKDCGYLQIGIFAKIGQGRYILLYLIYNYDIGNKK